MYEARSPLPTPRFFKEQSFSSKKDKSNSSASKPPPTPRQKLHGNSSSVSRLFSTKSHNSERAQSISFLDSKSSLSSLYDSSSDKLYFHQCFEVICKLGSGSFGEVFKVRCKEDGQLYAIKRAKDKFCGKSDRDRKLQEVLKHELLPGHPNCVRFYKAWEERQHLYIQTELCSCSLSQYAERNHTIPEQTVWNFLVDLLLAVKHLHDHNLVHLDIKPDNIFITNDRTCKLGDFGIVLDLSKSDVTDAIEGDPRYIAPELMQGVFSKPADIFSLGITILELASDLDLPRGDEEWHLLRNLKIPEEFLRGLSGELTEVISLMMEPDYTKRYSADEILSINSVAKILQKRKARLWNSEHHDSYSSPKNYLSLSSEWNSSVLDDVFDDELSKFHSSFNDSLKDKDEEFCHDVSFYSVHNSSFEFPRNIQRGMSTPCGFRYWDAKSHDTSGSPCLSSSKKKGLSPSNDSPKFTKSPRLQLFSARGSEEDLSILSAPAKNLMNLFNSVSSSDESS
ncbi:LOW QUALITY PROTEIN: membrane-associated tyrosine- and threonine-specific cdc2-inhibitory kinase-like [Uloborus diversus]|uniref:LOW QUALITY PROTEIN: membrane-associated tyrosine- and threonine-specific cdc2-inhibitory kinase-like n=1 Tax=Uloborus diversus TaxID=327109 RepID=UPI002409D04F|nr:LOW QUALITY PROTEIN: membrane-associated tyrosine- and threonine-specific cdc2-inhibitory kinase-like [Uloborus diversus]